MGAIELDVEFIVVERVWQWDNLHSSRSMSSHLLNCPLEFLFFGSLLLFHAHFLLELQKWKMEFVESLDQETALMKKEKKT